MKGLTKAFNKTHTKIIKTFKDAAMSGKTTDRPGLEEMIDFIKKTSSQITSSIKFLTSPSSWVKGYQEGKEKFPFLKTLVMDDIDVQKIAEFVTKDRKAQEATQMQTAAKECIKTLQAEVPDWSNDLYNDIRSYAVTQGLPSEQVDTIVDPNVIQILNKARLYDAGKKVAAKKKAAKAPVKVLRSKKSPTNINEGKVKRQAAAMKALNDSSGLSGDLDAIADVLMNRWET